MLRFVAGISLVTSVILLLRRITDRKLKHRYHYALWLVIPVFMLLYPIASIKATLPKLPDIQVIKTQSVTDAHNDNNLVGQTRKDETPDPIPIEENAADPAPVQTQAKRTINWDATLRNISLLISLIILAGLAVYNLGFILYCIRRRKILKTDPASGLKVYKLDNRSTPFLLGRSIYVNAREGEPSRYVLCHEACHYRHGDMYWVVLRYVVLALNWYNPLIWAAYVQSGRDCELACDEEVLEILGRQEATEYARTLLALIGDRAGFSFSITKGMRGTFNVMKKRITSIKHPNQNSTAATVICVALAVTVAGCSLIEYNEVETETVSPSEEVTVAETTSEPTYETSSETSIETTPADPVIERIPDIGELSDGQYTVAMTPVKITEADGTDTYVFFPWVLYELDEDFINNLTEGQIIEFPDDFDEVNAEYSEQDLYVEEIILRHADTYSRYGTSYTGDIISIGDNSPLNFRKTVSGTWELFFYEVPAYISYEPMRLPISPDLRIFDAYHVGIDELTPEQIADVLEFRDTTLTEGRVGSVEEFFEEDNDFIMRDEGSFDIYLNSHTFTVITVENNEITEVYFWYQP
ncbi:MAG: M56 family metallopeptidase [Clostridiales bacterium]|nr:M56 family metallopeptidase [Clostridiales bacterium]